MQSRSPARATNLNLLRPRVKIGWPGGLVAWWPDGPLRAPLVFLAALEVIERLWPVVLQQSRQAAVGEQLAAGLARRAIVRFVGRVLDSLDRRAAHGTRLSIAAVGGHAFAKRRHLLGKFSARLRDQLVTPLGKHANRVRVE